MATHRHLRRTPIPVYFEKEKQNSGKQEQDVCKLRDINISIKCQLMNEMSCTIVKYVTFFSYDLKVYFIFCRQNA